MTKEIIKELQSYNLTKLNQLIKDNPYISDDFILEVISKPICQPENLLIHQIRKREDRNKFFESLKNLLNKSGFFKALEFISDKYFILETSELIFDKIKSSISETDISKLENGKQIWAHIARAKGNFEIVRQDIENHLAQNQDAYHITPTLMVTGENGYSYSPDTAFEKQVEYLTITLQMLGNQYKLFKKNILYIPKAETLSDEEIFKAGSIELLARVWGELENVANRCLFEGGKIYFEKVLDQDNQEINKYSFIRDESHFEMLDAISNERLFKKILQNNVEIATDIDSSYFLEDKTITISNKKQIEEVNLKEIQIISGLSDILCDDIYNSKVLLGNLTLKEWVKGYLKVQDLSKSISENEIDSIFDKSKLIEIFELLFSDKNKAEWFIDKVSFGKDSRDLYDCPLVNTEDNKIFLFHDLHLSSNIITILFSRLSSLDLNYKSKGYNFENRVNSTIQKRCKNTKSFKFKKGSNEYEYDCVFILDKTVFVVECKNNFLSSSNPVKMLRKKEFIDKAVNQVHRLKDALISHPEVFKEHFNKEISDFKVIPIILNCLPFAFDKEYNNTYIIDSSSLFRFFEKRYLNKVIFDKKSKIEVPVFDQWSKSYPTDKSLINFLNNPKQITTYKNSRKKINQPWPASNDTIFYKDIFITDFEELKRQELKIFNIKTNTLKSKKKKKKKKNSISNNSKRKNRKKK